MVFHFVQFWMKKRLIEKEENFWRLNTETKYKDIGENTVNYSLLFQFWWKSDVLYRRIEERILECHDGNVLWMFRQTKTYRLINFRTSGFLPSFREAIYDHAWCVVAARRNEVLNIESFTYSFNFILFCRLRNANLI